MTMEAITTPIERKLSNHKRRCSAEDSVPCLAPSAAFRLSFLDRCDCDFAPIFEQTAELLGTSGYFASIHREDGKRSGAISGQVNPSIALEVSDIERPSPLDRHHFAIAADPVRKLTFIHTSGDSRGLGTSAGIQGHYSLDGLDCCEIERQLLGWLDRAVLTAG